MKYSHKILKTTTDKRNTYNQLKAERSQKSKLRSIETQNSFDLFFYKK